VKSPLVSGVTPSTMLERAPELTLRLNSSGDVSLVHDGTSVTEGPHTLAILDAFSTPRSFGEVVAELNAKGARDFVEMTASILRLVDAGVLRGPGGVALMAEASRGFDTASLHAQMLGDTARTQAFIDALKKCVTRDDVVVDVGTGTGVLAIAAAQAGARKVYAIEASSMGDTARELVAINGVSDRVEIVRGWSTRISLPERGTILVSETIGNEPFGEKIVEIMDDATKRLLVPGARRIPRRLRVYAVLATMPDALRARHLFTDDNLAAWNATFGIDFTPLGAAVRRRQFVLYLNPQDVHGWSHLAPPVLLADIDLSAPPMVFDERASTTVTGHGPLHAALIYFELDLADGVVFDAHPDRVHDRHSWIYVTWILPRAREVSPGDRVELRYSYAGGNARLEVTEPA
jgi:protein arginine N-methyltransferase 1